MIASFGAVNELQFHSVFLALLRFAVWALINTTIREIRARGREARIVPTGRFSGLFQLTGRLEVRLENNVKHMIYKDNIAFPR